MRGNRPAYIKSLCVDFLCQLNFVPLEEIKGPSDMFEREEVLMAIFVL